MDISQIDLSKVSHPEMARKELDRCKHLFRRRATSAAEVDIYHRESQRVIELIDFIPERLHEDIVNNTCTEDIMPYYLKAFRTLCTFTTDNPEAQYGYGGSGTFTGTGGTILFPDSRTLIVDSTFEPITYWDRLGSSISNITTDFNNCRLKLADDPSPWCTYNSTLFLINAQNVENLVFRNGILDGNNTWLGRIDAPKPAKNGLLGSTDGLKYWFNVSNPDGITYESLWNYDSHAALYYMARTLDAYPDGEPYIANIKTSKCIFGPYANYDKEICHQSYNDVGSNNVRTLDVSFTGDGLWQGITYAVVIDSGDATFSIVRRKVESFAGVELTTEEDPTYLRETLISTGVPIANWTVDSFEFTGDNLTEVDQDEKDWLTELPIFGTLDYRATGQPTVRFDPDASYTAGEEWEFMWVDLRKVNFAQSWGVQTNPRPTEFLKSDSASCVNHEVSNNLTFNGGETVWNAGGINHNKVVNNIAISPSYGSYGPGKVSNDQYIVNNHNYDTGPEHAVECGGSNVFVVGNTFEGQAEAAMILKTQAGLPEDFGFNNWIIANNRLGMGYVADDFEPGDDASGSAGIIFLFKTTTNPYYTTPTSILVTGNIFSQPARNSGEVPYAINHIEGNDIDVAGLVISNNTVEGTGTELCEPRLKTLAEKYDHTDGSNYNSRIGLVNNSDTYEYHGLYWGTHESARPTEADFYGLFSNGAVTNGIGKFNLTGRLGIGETGWDDNVTVNVKETVTSNSSDKRGVKTTLEVSTLAADSARLHIGYDATVTHSDTTYDLTRSTNALVGYSARVASEGGTNVSDAVAVSGVGQSSQGLGGTFTNLTLFKSQLNWDGLGDITGTLAHFKVGTGGLSISGNTYGFYDDLLASSDTAFHTTNAKSYFGGPVTLGTNISGGDGTGTISLGSTTLASCTMTGTLIGGQDVSDGGIQIKNGQGRRIAFYNASLVEMGAMFGDSGFAWLRGSGGSVKFNDLVTNNHAESHTVASHSDTTVTGPQLNTLYSDALTASASAGFAGQLLVASGATKATSWANAYIDNSFISTQAPDWRIGAWGTNATTTLSFYSDSGASPTSTIERVTGANSDFTIENTGTGAIRFNTNSALALTLWNGGWATFESGGTFKSSLFIEGDLGNGTAGSISHTNATDTPTTDPGWTTSSTVNMTAPDGYIKAYVGTQAVTIPYWNT